ncbi:hypothetical protein D3C87_1948800 [compost metagenome]
MDTTDIVVIMTDIHRTDADTKKVLFAHLTRVWEVNFPGSCYLALPAGFGAC